MQVVTGLLGNLNSLEFTVCCWSSLSFARPQRIGHIGHILKLACQRKQWSVNLGFDKGLTENQGRVASSEWHNNNNYYYCCSSINMVAAFS